MALPALIAATPAVAVAVRYIIMAAVQLGLWSLIEKYGLPILRKAVEEVVQTTGVSEEEAKDMAANEILTAFAAVGIFAVTLRSKLPLKVADYLGFTTKGWSSRKLSSKLASVTGAPATAAITTKVATSDEVAVVVKNTVTSRKLSSQLVGSLYGKIIAFVGATSVALMTVGNFIDFANWEGAYQGTFQKILGVLGFEADKPTPKANTVSADIWKKIYATVEELNPQTIAFPWKDEVRPYSRQNLVDAVDHFAANLSAQGQQATFKSVWAMLLPCIGIKPGGTSTSAAASLPAAGAGVSTYAPVKVFTGVLSNGTLGAVQPFSAREDDLINSAQELRDVAQTNAAAFVAALPGKIVYELKIANNVIAADGTKRVGSTVQVPNGVTKAGAQKYKFVTNKFAVMVLYYVKKDGTRTKIADITLGPTDIARFNPSPQELTGIGNNLVQTVSTSKTDDITTIISNTPTTSETPQASELEPLPNYNTQPKEPGDTGYRFYVREIDPGQFNYSAIEWAGNIPFGHSEISEETYRRATGDTKDYTNSGYKFVNGTITRDYAVTPSNVLPSQVAAPMGTGYYSKTQITKVANLSEYYKALGQPLPSLSARGQTYQSLGLGAASLYTGTVEQNTKLLIALQAS